MPHLGQLRPGLCARRIHVRWRKPGFCGRAPARPSVRSLWPPHPVELGTDRGPSRGSCFLRGPPPPERPSGGAAKACWLFSGSGIWREEGSSLGLTTHSCARRAPVPGGPAVLRLRLGLPAQLLGSGRGGRGVLRGRVRERLRVPARPLLGRRPLCACRPLALLPPTPAPRPR